LFIKAGQLLVTDNSSPLKEADAIIILGGDSGSRSLNGLELYKKGYGRYILLTGIENGEPGAMDYYLNWRAQIFSNAGVERNNILFDKNSRNTWEEADNTFRLMQKLHWRHVIVVSDPPHMRRLKLVWDKVFKSPDLSYSLYPSTPTWWKADQWWSNETSAKFVFEEYLKLLYYFVVH
jgi:uncharacterized SAM-binding protein YcdF (DUF218 family)